MDFYKDHNEGAAGNSEGSSCFLEADVAIVGGGVAGLYSAYCCGLAGLTCALVEALAIPGGQCAALYPDKKMYGTPGFDSVRAKDFVAALSEQCLPHTKYQLFGFNVEHIARTDSGEFTLSVQKKTQSVCSVSDFDKKNISISSKYLILATGIGDMRPNIPSTILGVDGISKDSDFIQFYCLNLLLYKNKNVIIAGGGDSAIDFAIDISSVAKHVKIIHRRNKFSCEPSKLKMISALEDSGRLDVMFERNICKVSECGGMRTVTVVDTDLHELEMETDHIVFCYGFSANLGNLLDGTGIKTENGRVSVDINSMETSVENCYAAGDVVSYVNKKRNVVPCFFEADRAVRSIKSKISGR